MKKSDNQDTEEEGKTEMNNNKSKKRVKIILDHSPKESTTKLIVE